jgi:hypothetical protein
MIITRITICNFVILKEYLKPKSVSVDDNDLGMKPIHKTNVLAKNCTLMYEHNSI